MIKFNQNYTTSGTGLGYQISSYILMRSLEIKTGQTWTINPSNLKSLRHTFQDLNLNVVENDKDYGYKLLELDDEVGFDGIVEKLSQYESTDVEIDLYPTVKNMVAPDNGDTFLKVKQELKFRDIIYNKCLEFRNKFDGEVIAMHVRRGDFVDITNGMFLCGADYYENALKELPADIPVLVFTNDKDSVIQDSALIASDPSRFTFITDLFNDNQLIDCDYGQELDRLVDINGDTKFSYEVALAGLAKQSFGYLPSYPELSEEMKRIVLEELHPKYKEKLKTNSYNHSYDLCLMSMCDYHIMANSTFSMWGAELSRTNNVIYPKYWMQGHVDNVQIKSDLGDYDQTRDLASQIINRDNYHGIANPDPRSFTIVR